MDDEVRSFLDHLDDVSRVCEQEWEDEMKMLNASVVALMTSMEEADPGRQVDRVVRAAAWAATRSNRESAWQRPTMTHSSRHRSVV